MNAIAGAIIVTAICGMLAVMSWADIEKARGKSAFGVACIQAGGKAIKHGWWGNLTCEH